MKYDTTASIVVYKNDFQVLEASINSFLNTKLRTRLFISDNSPDDTLRQRLRSANCEYLHHDANLGFGKAHNVCMRKVLDTSKYHLVLNPDVYFPPGTIEQVYEYMEAHPEVGLVLPMVRSDTGEVQHLCKRLPTPLDLLTRRFLPDAIFKKFRGLNDRYLMLDKDYHTVFEAPSLSGCFMFFRTSALKDIGLFDERFFMYMEDIDISRRMHARFKTVYYPNVYIVHGHARESYRLNRLLLVHIRSAIQYFNKWGWLIDKERRKVNRDT